MKKKLCLIQDPQLPPSIQFYRTMGPISQLSEISFYKESYQNFLSSELNSLPYDVVMIERPVTQHALQIASQAKRTFVKVWVDFDDNLLEIPVYNKARDYYANERNIKLVQNILGLADIVTVSTPYLKNLYQGYTPNGITVIENGAFDKFPFKKATSAKGPIKIVWRGGGKHEGDLFGARVPLSEAMKNPKLAFMFVGFRPWFLDVKDGQYIPFSDLFTYFNSIFSSGLDYMVVPLENNNFNRSKSNCSWIECTIAGGVCIAPAYLPEFDKPGIIRYKDNAHLRRIFQKVASGHFDKLKLWEESFRYISENLILSNLNKKRLTLLD